MTEDTGHHQHFDAIPESTRAVRHAVIDALTRWGCDALVDDAVLGASELASNAVLHTRGPFELVMRPIAIGARVEVIDRRPDLVPMPVPTVGSATAVTAQGTTGRGLQIVAALASRWGFNTSQAFKAVWMEVSSDPVRRVVEPVIEMGYKPEPEEGVREFRLLSMPVRAAVGSGVQVDDLVRGLQMSPADGVSEDEVRQLNWLLDSSAPARLLGRHAALDAAAQNHERFDMTVELSMATLHAFGALNQLLVELSSRFGSMVALPEPVMDFRRWLLREIAAQAAGAEPTPCELPAG